MYWGHCGDKRRYFYVSGEGNLIFCCTAVGRIVTGRLVVKIIIILNFRVGTSKNKDIDHQVRHLYTSYIWNRPHMYSVIQQLFFYVFHCDLKEKYIRIQNFKKEKSVCEISIFIILICQKLGSVGYFAVILRGIMKLQVIF